MPTPVGTAAGDMTPSASDAPPVARVREAGCLGLFCGVESFDPALNKTYNKRQNLLLPQVEMIKTCLEAGVVFQYGLIFDPAAQRLEQMQNELDFIVQCDLIPLPAFMTLTIPLLGTPHFDERVKSGHFLPLAKLRDVIRSNQQFVQSDLPSPRGSKSR